MKAAKTIFNVLLRHKNEHTIIVGVDEDILKSIVQAIDTNKPSLEVFGEVYDLRLNSIKIYDLSKLQNIPSRGWLIEHIEKTRIAYNIKTGLKLIKEFGMDITDEYFGVNISNSPTSVHKKNQNGKIFISHSSKDEYLVQLFVERILMLALGLTEDDIFCTSIQGMGIQSGANFKEVIKNELISSKAIIQVLTDNYKESHICLNEMGAAWVLNDNVIPLIGPNCDYDVGFIHGTTQQLKISKKEDLLKFYDDHRNLFGAKEIKIGTLSAQIEKFLNGLEGISPTQKFVNEKEYYYDEQMSISGILMRGRYGFPFATEDTPIENQNFIRYLYIILPKPINVLKGGFPNYEEGDFNFSKANIDRIQITTEDLSDDNLSDFISKEVIVTGKLWGAFSGHHRTEVLLTCNKIQLS